MTKKDSKPQTLQQFPTSALHSMNAPLGGKPSLDQREPGKGSGPGWFVTESADNCGKPGDSNHEEVLLRHQVFSNAIFPTKCFNLVEVAPSCSGTKLTADPRTLKNLDDATCNAPNATSNCHLPRIWSSKELEHILEHHPIFCHNHMMSDNYKPFGSSRVECPCIRRNWWWSMSMTSRKCFRQVANPRTPGIYMKALFCAASCTGQMWARQYLDLLGARVLFSTQASSMFDSARFDSFTEDWPDTHTHTQTHARTHAPTHPRTHARTHSKRFQHALTRSVSPSCQHIKQHILILHTTFNARGVHRLSWVELWPISMFAIFAMPSETEIHVRCPKMSKATYLQYNMLWCIFCWNLHDSQINNTAFTHTMDTHGENKTHFFPTCQVRVVRFYQSCCPPPPPPPPPLRPRPPPPPPPPVSPRPCLHQLSPPLPPCQLFASSSPTSELSAHCWTSTWDLPSSVSVHCWTSTWDLPSSVYTAGP